MTARENTTHFLPKPSESRRASLNNQSRIQCSTAEEGESRALRGCPTLAGSGMAGFPFLDCLPAVVNELSHALQVTSQLILVHSET